MLSIVCCSIDPDAANVLRKNIESTIGDIPFELIVFDNREANRGICEVYNLCAGKAKYNYLCFVHEDVCFDSSDWGKSIIERLGQEDCGVIGFAGCIVKLKRLTAWDTCYSGLRLNYIQHQLGGGGRKHYRINPNGVDFAPVVTLDGLCLFVRRNVWAEVLFDEQRFTRFHCYDIDFTLSVASRYRNYVCNTVLVEHFSEGSFSEEWFGYLKILHEKWEDKLPLYIKEDVFPSQLKAYDRLGEAKFIKLLIRKGLFSHCGLPDILAYCRKYPFYLKSWLLYFKYLKYRWRYR
ncbi:MAG: glycosyltransferase family protein [Tannerellaceae bacterium]|jgi:GT2 family glycosyltransferase|nr:glycosyltransferase family protein [Tannerellaceae bacterium]